MKIFTITKKDPSDKSEATIEGELSAEAVLKEREKALQAFQSRITLDGFRKGHIPEKILVEKVGELSIYEEAASLVLEKVYEDILKEAEVNPIDIPKVSITKISSGNPVTFKIVTAIVPKITLPDYMQEAKNISEKKEDVIVDEKEINQALDDMRRSVAHHEKHHKEGAAHVHEVHEEHTGKDLPEEELPALDDEFAKKIGNFPSLEILKEKVRESILNEKKIRAREKKRISIIEKIIEKTEISVPEILIENEMSKMFAEFRGNIERMGIGYDEYLTHIKKGEDDMRKEWNLEAEKRVKIQLILTQIAIEEKLEPEEKAVEKEVELILKEYKDAKKSNAELYVRNFLLNEKVWQLLETAE